MFLEVAILILAIPTGFLIAWLAKDELIQGRKWFKAIIILAIITGAWFFLTDQLIVTWTSAFVIIVSYISLHKSHDKKWTKRKT